MRKCIYLLNEPELEKVVEVRPPIFFNFRTPMDVISGMATMAMAIPTISFGHRSGHFWP